MKGYIMPPFYQLHTELRQYKFYDSWKVRSELSSSSQLAKWNKNSMSEIEYWFEAKISSCLLNSYVEKV